MRTVGLLIFALLAAWVMGQQEDIKNKIFVSRLVGTWKGHVHFDKMPDENPTDFYGTVSVHRSVTDYVEADIHIDAPNKDLHSFELKGVLGSTDTYNVDATPYHAVHCVFYGLGNPGYLLLNGELSNNQILMKGGSVPTFTYLPNGKTVMQEGGDADHRCAAMVQLEGDDEISIELLGSAPGSAEPLKSYGFIKLTRVKS